MSSFVGIVGLIASVATFFLIFGLLRNLKNNFESSFVKSSVVWTALSFAMLEILSLLNLIAAIPLTALWLLVTCGLVIWSRKNSIQLRLEIPNIDWRSIPVLPAIIIGSILFLSLIYAPTTWDSMTYHLPRVDHWIQNGNLNPYATWIDRQVFMSPMAELLILQFKLFTSTDLFAQSVQFFSLILVFFAGGAILKDHLKVRGKEFLYFVTLLLGAPMIVVQASSTQTDLAASAWILVSVLFLIRKDWYFLGLSAGIAYLTKGTAAVFLIPFVIFYGIYFARKDSFSKTLRGFVITGLIALVINLPQFVRNFTTFDHPLGYPPMLRDFKVVPSAENFLSSFVKNLGLNLAYGRWASTQWVDGVNALDTKLQIDPNEVNWRGMAYEANAMRRSESLVGNFFVFSLVISSLLFCRRITNFHLRAIYFCSLAAFLFFCYQLKWQPWGVRLQTPFFVLISIPLAFLLSKIIPERIGPVFRFLLLVSVLPWVFSNGEKPFITTRSTLDEALFLPRASQYFVPRPELEASYNRVIESLQENACDKIDFIGAEDAWEYPLQYAGLKVNHIEVPNPTRVLEKDIGSCGLVLVEAKDRRSVCERHKRNLKVDNEKLALCL